ncbi:MAG TPA: hypothetical protein VMF31_08435 [Solirubrobacterales bacterium]|nr:hypothetical protein [Solirubrobacterales bacterium]
MTRTAVLDRIEPWSTTGIGSLPFTDPALAANHACVGYELPFCPQLPRVEGDMISEWLGADPQLCGWSPERDRERPLVWPSFLEQVERHPPGNGVVKLQVTGPATLALALERQGGVHPGRARTLSLAREVSTWLTANVAGQIAILAERGLSTLLLIDEPAMALFGSDGTESVWDPLRAIAPAWGLHLCCAVPWDLVERAEPQVLSFDLTLERIDRRAASVLNRLIAKDGMVAWGAISAHRQEHAIQANSRLGAALSRVPAARERSLVTASCGTGRMSPGREYEVATALSDVARKMRASTAVHG